MISLLITKKFLKLRYNTLMCMNAYKGYTLNSEFIHEIYFPFITLSLC